MQLFAINQANELVSASKAERQHDYICPECRSRVRVRAGQFRTTHFFHLDEERHCRQNGKSLQHLHAQFRLQQMLPDVKLEQPFPSISRIADVAWEREKIVFEIQCSPITSEELLARNRDYASVGWTTIWIFHEDRYNKKRLTAAEWAMRLKAHYFTDIDEHGQGDFYSHLCDIERGCRYGLILRKKITFESPIQTHNTLHFLNDGWDGVFLRNENQIDVPSLSAKFLQRSRLFFKSIFYHFLEKSCR